MQSPQFQLHAEIEQRHWWFVGRRRIMRRLIDAVLAPPATVVDVGCGTGANIAALADSYSCVGIDTSVEAIRLARHRFPRVRFIAGRAPEDLGGLIEQANLFLLMDVLEHIDDDVAMFSGLLAAAAPGSYFLVTVPADPSLWSAHDESFGHRRRYDRAGLERLWVDLPVSPVLVSCFNARLLPLVRIVRSWGRRRGRAAGEAGTDFWLPNPALNRILQATLAGEARRLLRLIDNRAGGGYRRGASLLALLRREEGPVRPEPTPEPAASLPE